MRSRALALVLACAAMTRLVSPLNASATSGGLFICDTPCGAANATPLSFSTSSLNAAMAAAAAAAPRLAAPNTAMLLNARGAPAVLSFVAVSGAWTADVPLYIPAQTVFSLADGTVLTAAAELATATPSAVVYANGSYSALVAPSGTAGGARILCDWLPVRGVLASGATGFVLDGVTLAQCGGTSASCSGAVHYVGTPFNSGGVIARCAILDGCRGVWVQTYSKLLVRDNEVRNSSKFGIDFDSYAKDSVVLGNSVTGSGQSGVFLEQGSLNIVVVDNVITDSFAAISTYNYRFASVTSGHAVVNNYIARCDRALSTGSTAGVNWTGASNLLYFGNTLAASNGVGVYANGPQNGVVFSDNTDPVGFGALALALAGSAVAFDPLGRAIAFNASRLPSATASSSGTLTPSGTSTPSETASPGSSSSITPSLSETPSGTATPTPTASPSVSAQPSPIMSPPLTPSPTPLPTRTPSPADAIASGLGAGTAGTAPLLAPLPALLWGSVGFVAGVALASAAAHAAAKGKRAQRGSAKESSRHLVLTAAPPALACAANSGVAAPGGDLSGSGKVDGGASSSSVWIARSDDSGDAWFENTLTGETAWEAPAANR